MKKRFSVFIGVLLIVAMCLSACVGGGTSGTSTSGGGSSGKSTTSKSETKAAGETGKAETPAADGNTDPIRIGVVNPRSGKLAVTGTDDHFGCMIAIDMFNEAGGVNGRMIEPVVADIPDAATAQTEINRLIQNENLSVITGCYGSSIVEVVAAICNRNNVFYWENVSILDRLTEQGYKSVFRYHISGSEYGVQAAQWAEFYADKLGIAKEDLTVGTINENGDFGQSIATGVERYCSENGIKLVLNESYEATTTDTTPVVLKMKEADPDIIIATSYINDGIDITKKCKVLNYSPKVFLGIGSGYGAAAYYDTLGADSQGQIDLDPTNAPVLENLDPEMQELAKEFAKRFEAELGYAPTTVGYLGWESTWILLNNVVAQVNGDVDDLDGLIAAAKAVDIPEGTMPTGYGCKFNDKGQNERCVIASMQWQDGKLVTIYPEELSKAEPIRIPMPAWDER